MRVTVQKIGSVSKNVPLRSEVRLSPQVVAQEGYLVCGRVIGNKTSYNTLEACDGRMVKLHDGDLIVGALGKRNALHGYSGVVPASVKAGDTLQILNLGGVIGTCTSSNPEIGKPFDIEVLGSVLVFPELGDRKGVPAHIGMNSIAAIGSLEDAPSKPIILIVGTSMNSGKTFAACEVIRYLSAAGKKVAACKLSGVSLLKDTLNMSDHGAYRTASFNDAGIVTTDPASSLRGAEVILTNLLHTDCDLVVAELGDGILGTYGVQEILKSKAIKARTKATVVCAADPVGAWGAKQVLATEFEIVPTVFSGPVTDHAVGAKFVSDQLGIAALNARSQAKELSELLLKAVQR